MTLTNNDVLAETAYDVMFNLHPNWTVDHLLNHPAEAIKFCDVVRRKVGKDVNDHQILGALKHGGPAGRRQAS